MRWVLPYSPIRTIQENCQNTKIPMMQTSMVQKWTALMFDLFKIVKLH